MASITVDILTGDPSIKINKVDTIPVYIRKENMVSVVTASNKNLQSVNPNAPRDEEYIIYILDNNGDITAELKDIDEVKKLYHCSHDDIVELEMGVPVSLRQEIPGRLLAGELHILQKKNN